MAGLVAPSLPLISALTVVTVLLAIYIGFHRYDWGQPFTKLMCFAAIGTGVLALHRAPPVSAQTPPWTVWVECLAYGLLLLWVLQGWGTTYLPHLKDPPWVDVGYTTQNAARLFWNEGDNPYTRTDINPRAELAPEHRGFHYGPAMFLGYAAATVHPWGYKLSSLSYLLLTLAGMALITRGLSTRGASEAVQLARTLFVVTGALLCERYWYELFRQGVSDIFPVCLIVFALLALQRGAWAWAGALLGLSFAAKFSPAAFLIILLCRRATPARFYIGGLIGALPLLPFALWDPVALYENVFRLRFILGFDSTSLYSITPAALHILFPLTQLVAVAACLVYNFYRPVDLRGLLVQFTLLLIIMEVTFKEIHANHLIWFLPLIPLAFADSRHRLFTGLTATFKPPMR